MATNLYPIHEHAARAAKVAALADAFEEHARRVGAESPAVVAGLAVEAPERLWLDLAESAGIRRPSPTTIEATVLRIRRRAESAGRDPFEGF